MSMWGGGVAPPKPPSVDPPSKSKRNKVVDTELEALRQKGLAKLLNRHFTSVTKQISEERAAADEALRDLESRKANTSKFNLSKGGYSIYDEKVKDLQHKKAGVRRKERETLLLYQRYVDKFGGTGAVAVPNTSDFKKSDSKSSRKTKKSGKKSSKITDRTEGTAQKNALLESERNSNIGFMELIDTPNSKKIGDGHPASSGNRQEVDNKFSTAKSDGQLISNNGMNSGSIFQSSQKPTALYSGESEDDSGINRMSEKPPLIDSTVNSLTASFPPLEEERVDRYDELRPLTPKSEINDTAMKNSANKRLTPTITYEESEDERSTVSGLTTMDSIALSEAESRLYEFIKSETEAIRQMMEEEEENSVSTGALSGGVYSATSSFGNESTLAAKKAELMVQQMQEMMDEYKASSIKNEPLLGPEKTQFEPYELKTSNPDESWTVLWCDNHKREYYHEKNSGKTQWEKPLVSKTDAKWEKQTTATDGDDDYVPMTDFSKGKKHPKNLASYYEPEDLSSSQRRPTRREIYRKRQRKLRNRRRFFGAIAFLITFSVAVLYCYRRQKTDPAFKQFLGTVIGEENVERLNDLVPQNAKEIGKVGSSKKVENVKQSDHHKVKLESEKLKQAEKRKLEAQKKEEEQKFRAAAKEHERQEKEGKARIAKAEREKAERLRREEEQTRIAKIKREEVERQHREEEEKARIAKAKQEKAELQRRVEEEKARIVKAKQEEAERKRREKEEKEQIAKAQEEERLRVLKAKEEEARRKTEEEKIRIANEKEAKRKVEEAKRRAEEDKARALKSKQKAKQEQKGKEEKLRIEKKQHEARRREEEERNRLAKAQLEVGRRQEEGKKRNAKAQQEKAENLMLAASKRNKKPERMETEWEKLERQRKIEDAKWKELERKAKEERAKLAKAKREESKALAMAKKEHNKKEREEKRRKRRNIEVKEGNNQLVIRRPWHCNLPLFYLINKTCRQLSTANPIFDLSSLVDVMMQ